MSNKRKQPDAERLPPASLTSRREFLTEAALAATGLSLAGCFPDVGGRWPAEASFCVDPATSAPAASRAPMRVAEIHDEASVSYDPATGRIELHPAVVRTMVEAAVRIMSRGSATPWRTLLPDYALGMRIGLKVNCLNPECATSVPVVRAVVEGLQAELGVPSSDLLVWDRRGDELTNAGFTEAAVGVPVLGTVKSFTDGAGPGYESDYCTVVGGKTTRFSRIVTQLTDITINCPVLKKHDVSGVTGAMKNLYGAIHNPGDFHDDIQTALPAIYAMAPLRERIRLTILDALVAVTLGSTSSPVDTISCRVLGSQDPVALDTYALQLVNKLRAAKEQPAPPLDESVTAWLGEAERLGLGLRKWDLLKGG